MTFFWGENIARLRRSGGCFECRRFLDFSCVGFVEKRRVSLLTELENVFEWFSTKMPPLRGSGRVFHSNETRAGKGKKPKTCGRRPKHSEPFIFTLKKQIEHA